MQKIISIPLHSEEVQVRFCGTQMHRDTIQPIPPLHILGEAQTKFSICLHVQLVDTIHQHAIQMEMRPSLAAANTQTKPVAT